MVVGPVGINELTDAAISGQMTPSSEIIHSVHTGSRWCSPTAVEPLRVILGIAPPIRDRDHRQDELSPQPAPPHFDKTDKNRHEESTHGTSPMPAKKRLTGRLLLESAFVDFDENGEFDIRVRNQAEARAAIKALKDLKAKLSLEIRKLNSTMKLIRSEYTASVRQRGSVMRGGGNIGKFVRTIQGLARDAARRQLAKNLEPHERAKHHLETLKHRIDTIILAIESAK